MDVDRILPRRQLYQTGKPAGPKSGDLFRLYLSRLLNLDMIFTPRVIKFDLVTDSKGKHRAFTLQKGAILYAESCTIPHGFDKYPKFRHLDFGIGDDTFRNRCSSIQSIFHKMEELDFCSKKLCRALKRLSVIGFTASRKVFKAFISYLHRIIPASRFARKPCRPRKRAGFHPVQTWTEKKSVYNGQQYTTPVWRWRQNRINPPALRW